MSNSSFNDCTPIDYYAQQKSAQLEQEIYDLKSIVNTYLRSSCINPAFSLIGYTTEIVAPSDKETIPFGTIAYYQTVITNSFNGDRIWTFTLGGEITAPAFWIKYQFDPNCIVPNGYNFAPLKHINFYKNNQSTEYEPLQGTVTVNNIGLPISDAPLVVSLDWNASTGLLIFKFSVTRNTLSKYDNYSLQAEQIDNTKFGQKNPQSLFINLTIRDETCVVGIGC